MANRANAPRAGDFHELPKAFFAELLRAARHPSTATHPIMATKENISAGLMSAAMPVNAPSRIQLARLGALRVRKASVSIATKKRAEKFDSQKMTGSHSTGSERVQIAPATYAAAVPKNLRASRIISAMVPRAAAIFRNTITIADLKVYTPNNKKIPATIVGYPGAMKAVGPVGTPNGELYPRPWMSDLASNPISQGCE